jgi:hypothetical protein
MCPIRLAGVRGKRGISYCDFYFISSPSSSAPECAAQPAAMHSTLNRVQSAFGFFTTITFFVAALTALSVLLYPANPTTSVKLTNIQV